MLIIIVSTRDSLLEVNYLYKNYIIFTIDDFIFTIDDFILVQQTDRQFPILFNCGKDRAPV